MNVFWISSYDLANIPAVKVFLSVVSHWLLLQKQTMGFGINYCTLTIEINVWQAKSLYKTNGFT